MTSELPGKEKELQGYKLSEIFDISKMVSFYNEKIWPIISFSYLKKINYWVLGRKLQIKEGEKILEVGSGSEINYSAVAKKVGKDGLYVALDVDEKVQARAKKSYLFFLKGNKGEEKGKAEHAVGDGVNSLPFAADTFDSIVASNFTGMNKNENIFSTKGWDLFLKEALRVLKPGGKIASSYFEFQIPLASILYFHKFKKAGFENVSLSPGNPSFMLIGMHWIISGVKPNQDSGQES